MCARTTNYRKHAPCAVAYDRVYDSFWCLDHKVWTEDRCEDDTCNFCSIRPEKLEEGRN